MQSTHIGSALLLISSIPSENNGADFISSTHVFLLEGLTHSYFFLLQQGHLQLLSYRSQYFPLVEIRWDSSCSEGRFIIAGLFFNRQELLLPLKCSVL
ncbi:hypothetical protein D3C80_1796390 [compost metagenome]